MTWARFLEALAAGGWSWAMDTQDYRDAPHLLVMADRGRQSVVTVWHGREGKRVLAGVAINGAVLSPQDLTERTLIDDSRTTVSQ